MLVKAMVSTRTLANNPTFPGNLVPVKLQAPFFLYIVPNPNYHFWKMLHFPDLSRFLNDLICHDPRWPPMLTKFPSDIPKFEGKPGEDPGDHVTTFHLWCSSNSL
jgi:hypothetical protein